LERNTREGTTQKRTATQERTATIGAAIVSADTRDGATPAVARLETPSRRSST
jgi:hypothetical protein